MNRLLILACIAALLAACTTEPEEPVGGEESQGGGAAPTNRIDIPPQVVRNLGITFAQVEKRRVAQTLRLPGAFEAPPDAMRLYRAPLGGRVRTLVNQYDEVRAGTEIARINSPQWRDMQSTLDALQSQAEEAAAAHKQAGAELASTQAAVSAYPRRIEAFAPQLTALEEHLARLQGARDLWTARVAELEDLIEKGGGRATELAGAKAELALAEAALSDEREKRAELERQRIELSIDQEVAAGQVDALKAAQEAARVHAEASRRSFELKLHAAAATLGVEPETLADDAWRKLHEVPVHADADVTILDLDVGVGEIVEPGAALCHAMDRSRIRFRARGMQSDLGRLKSGLSARAVPPSGGTLEGGEPAEGTIILAPKAEAESRLLDVLMTPESVPAWARPGVTGELEVVWDATEQPEMAVPVRAIVRDGLDLVIFRRDHLDRNKVVREKPPFGPSDGRWRVIYGGNVGVGSEVVLDGVYELKLTGAGKAAEGGHFHADGTWHAGPAHD